MGIQDRDWYKDIGKPQHSSENVKGYKCPSCKTINPRNVKYCVKCGQWLFVKKHKAGKLGAALA